VNVPPPSSGGVIAALRTRSASVCVSRAISPSDSRPRRTPSARPARSPPRPQRRRSRASAAAVARAGSCRSPSGARAEASAHAFTTMSLYVGAFSRSAAPGAPGRARAVDLFSCAAAARILHATSICSVKSGIVASTPPCAGDRCCVRDSSTMVVLTLRRRHPLDARHLRGRRCVGRGAWLAGDDRPADGAEQLARPRPLAPTRRLHDPPRRGPAAREAAQVNAGVSPAMRLASGRP